MGSRALAVSLPFSCALGFLSSAIASTIGKLSCQWVSLILPEIFQIGNDGGSLRACISILPK